MRRLTGEIRLINDYLNPSIPEGSVREMNSLALAHVGDAVFELMVRLYNCEKNEKAVSLHRATVEMVNASAQARDIQKLRDALTEEEAAVFRRARNARVNSVPKNATSGDYHAATGLEALFGWLYLMGRRDRLSELFHMILEDD